MNFKIFVIFFIALLVTLSGTNETPNNRRKRQIQIENSDATAVNNGDGGVANAQSGSVNNGIWSPTGFGAGLGSPVFTPISIPVPTQVSVPLTIRIPTPVAVPMPIRIPTPIVVPTPVSVPFAFMPSNYVLTPEQKIFVNQFRGTYSNLLTDPYFSTDALIHGLLEANKWNLLAASEALRKTLSWRVENRIDELNYEVPNAEMLRRFPWRVRATTYLGCPVLEMGWGRWLVNNYIQSPAAVNIYNRHSDQMWETVRWAIRNRAPMCQQAILIADIKGFLMQNVAGANTIDAVIRMALTLNERYTNMFERIICINAPQDFISLMKTLQPSLGVTARSFSIYSEDEVDLARQHIASYVDLSTLGAYFLGTRAD